MRIDELEKTNETATCGLDDSLSVAARIMKENDCSSVLVTEGTRLIGRVTDRDVCMLAFLKNRPPSEIRVAEVISTRTRTPGPSLDDLLAACQLDMGAARGITDASRPPADAGLGGRA